jgi:hypothetical protein
MLGILLDHLVGGRLDEEHAQQVDDPGLHGGEVPQLPLLKVGCLSKLVSIRNNRTNFGTIRNKTFVSVFASIPKQRVSMFRLNRNKQKTSRNSLIGSIFSFFS